MNYRKDPNEYYRDRRCTAGLGMWSQWQPWESQQLFCHWKDMRVENYLRGMSHEDIAWIAGF